MTGEGDSECVFDAGAWAAQTFGDCSFGDRRLTQRVVRMAEGIISNPSGTLPEQFPEWADLKAAYRFFEHEDVTFEAVAQPHWQQTRAVAAGRVLMICDTTELDFGIRRRIQGTGPTGNGFGNGFLLHNALMVDAASRAVQGVAGQAIHYRSKTKRPKNLSDTQRLKGKRESQIWGRVIQAIGAPAAGAEYVYVCDRGADNIEVFCHLCIQQSHWVIRAREMQRQVLTTDGRRMPLKNLLKTLRHSGSYELHLRARPGHPARTAKIEVCVDSMLFPVPHVTSPWVRSLKRGPIPMNVVWIREVDAPRGVKPIEWVLYTSLDISSFEAVWQIIEYYESRWLIEEYHKALKSGCSTTARQLRSAERLEPLVAMLSVVAMKLLQLKTLSATDPHRPAREIVPPLWLTMLKLARRKLKRVYDLTIREFYREVAKLGGFLGRRSDGEPGWITIWRGWEKLALLVRGAELALQIKSKSLKTCG